MSESSIGEQPNKKILNMTSIVQKTMSSLNEYKKMGLFSNSDYNRAHERTEQSHSGHELHDDRAGPRRRGELVGTVCAARRRDVTRHHRTVGTDRLERDIGQREQLHVEVDGRDGRRAHDRV